MQIANVKISKDIRAEDLAVLRLFHDRVVALANTKLVKSNNSKITASISLKSNADIAFSARLPPEEELAQFLMAFRFFYLQKEPTNFPKIINLVSRYSDDSYTAVGRTLKSQWKNCLFKNAMNIKINGKHISGSLLIDLWFNAHYFHSETEKRAELDRLNSLLQEDFCKYMLIDSAYNASDVVRRFHAGIGELFVPVGTLV